MSIRVLPGLPDKMNETNEALVRVISYGDNYEQIRKDGLNNIRRTWKASFSQQRGDVITIVRDFLNSTYGVEAFHCLMPDGEQVLVRVDGSYNRDYQYQNAVVDFSFGLREVVL